MFEVNVLGGAPVKIVSDSKSYSWIMMFHELNLQFFAERKPTHLDICSEDEEWNINTQIPLYKMMNFCLNW